MFDFHFQFKVTNILVDGMKCVLEEIDMNSVL